MRWPRFVRPGEGCGFHCDGPYMNRGTSRIFSSWIPLGRVKPQRRGLDAARREPPLRAPPRGLPPHRRRPRRPDVARRRPVGRPRHLRDAVADHRLRARRRPVLRDAHAPRRHRQPVPDRAVSAVVGQPLPTDRRAGRPPLERRRVRRPRRAARLLPGLGRWNNADFQDEWKDVDEHGRLELRAAP